MKVGWRPGMGSLLGESSLLESDNSASSSLVGRLTAGLVDPVRLTDRGEKPDDVPVGLCSSELCCKLRDSVPCCRCSCCAVGGLSSCMARCSVAIASREAASRDLRFVSA